jgi:aminoglycoside phosphotransferase (APT) family kinase protein
LTDWPSDSALWRSVASTLSDEIIPALRPGPAQAVARQLMGLARYGLDRGPDPTPARTLRLAAVIGAGAAAGWDEVAAQASAILTADRSGRAGAERAPDIRTVLFDFLTEDQAKAAPLLETFARHGTSQVEEDPGPPPESEALRTWLEQQLGTEIEEFTAAVMSGGHSRRMLDVRLVAAGSHLSLVVRVEQGGIFGTDGTSEGRLMKALAAAQVPVAPIRWVEPTGTVLGQPFFVMDRVAGTDEIDDVSLRGFAVALRQLHDTAPEQVTSGLETVPTGPEEGIEAAIDRWEQVYRRSVTAPVPLLDDVAAWLRLNLHPTGPLVLVHGDPGPGNFLHIDGRVTALTDWEFAHLGDAAEDWVYLAAMRGTRIMDLPGWVDWLSREVGIEYDQSEWKAWSVFNFFKGACANLTALKVFREGTTTGPNLLAVGTAVHLRLLRQAVEAIR